MSESTSQESHEVRVYKRQALSIAAQWMKQDPDELEAYEKFGKCFLDYPDPEKFGERVIIVDSSWWRVLRRTMADLIRSGVLPKPADGSA